MKKIFLASIATFLFSTAAFPQPSDAALRQVADRDRVDRSADGSLTTMSPAEHLSRGKTYFENRLFPQSREHFDKIFDNFATDPAMSGALFMTGRSYYWEREYGRAIQFLDRVAREYPATKDGREGLSFKAACHVRLGKNAEAAKIYEQYTVMYPEGERIDSAYLNIIDALREAGDYDEANAWVDKTRRKFAGMATETNALHGRLRMEIHRGKWADASVAADILIAANDFRGAMTTIDEVKYLKAFALEKAGNKQQAMDTYASIPNSFNSYWGGRASERLARGGAKFHVPAPLTSKHVTDNPVVYRAEVLEFSRKNKIDPRFVLAIMKQESSFRPGVKSPSAARGLLQLVFDTALKYNKKAGYASLQPDDLYIPRTNIAIGTQYISALKDEFGGLYEAIAASYNGGEDNAARWLNRSKPKDPAIFASEVGFAETKNYVFKVMNNFRVYRELYDENLARR
ncbi:MAG TPA: transglycosylase SLT domain-containing protein [Pyrinomonadaceae bacterium]|nr:transglycosylase SLT domain-containing protein [Pyrinomonadaceae bacterium]